MPYNPGPTYRRTGKWMDSRPTTENPNRKHWGTDYGAERGTAVPAADSGKVVYSGSGAARYGNMVIIEHKDADGNAYYTVYAHMRGDNMPAVDTYVHAGDIIGSGNGGDVHKNIRFYLSLSLRCLSSIILAPRCTA